MAIATVVEKQGQTLHTDLWTLAVKAGFDAEQFITGERNNRKVLLLPKTDLAMLETFERAVDQTRIDLEPYNDDFHYWGFYTSD